MNSLELISQQRQKEGRWLKIFLISSLLGSCLVHVGAMTLQVRNSWNTAPDLEDADEIEVTITEDIPEEAIQENLVTEEPPPEPDIPQEVAFAPDIPPPPIPLAPESQAPLAPGEDAPSKEPPSPTTDPISPLTNAAGETPATGKANGPITNPAGAGSGFGNANQPTGFAPGGKPDGRPEGKPEGKPAGKPGGTPGATAVRTAPPAPQPARSQQPVCVSCPKPQFQGTEASPRVDLRIRPDGSVEVRLRKSSGDPKVDRATLETMSKWRFDPQTVPQEGVQKRVRVTYEEEGSNFQRQNEQRRRQEAERRQIAEQEQRRREAEAPAKPPASAVAEPPKPVPAESFAPVEQPVPAPIAAPPPAPEPVPAPVDEPLPAPVPEPPPAPVYEPPPAPVEAPASDET